MSQTSLQRIVASLRVILLLVAVAVVGVLVSTILLRGGELPRPTFTGDGITTQTGRSTTALQPASTQGDVEHSDGTGGRDD